MQNGPEYECNGFYIFKSLFSFIAYLKRFIEEKMLTCRVLHSYSGLLLSNVINYSALCKRLIIASTSRL